MSVDNAPCLTFAKWFLRWRKVARFQTLSSAPITLRSMQCVSLSTFRTEHELKLSYVYPVTQNRQSPVGYPALSYDRNEHLLPTWLVHDCGKPGMVHRNGPEPGTSGSLTGSSLVYIEPVSIIPRHLLLMAS